MWRWICLSGLFGATSLFSSSLPAGEREPMWQVGLATIDITPSYNIRLTGYAVRKTESDGVAQHLWAKALAIGSDRERPAILITVDNCGVPANVRDEVVARLKKVRRIVAERVAICSSHTHTGPMLKGFAPNIFGEPLPPEQWGRDERYTSELTDALATVALRPLDDRRAS